jgi:membrane protein YqaA with SNARE-associated domain
MELWERLAELLPRLIEEYDDQAIFLWVLVDETGFPLPLPGDFAILIAGYRVAQGAMHLVWALALLEVATLLGGSVLYWLGRAGVARCCTATDGSSASTVIGWIGPRSGWRAARRPRSCWGGSPRGCET